MGTVHAIRAETVDPLPQVEKWFARDRKGEIVFTGQSYEDHVSAWDDAQIDIDKGLWGQAQIAASLVTKHGERTVRTFAYDVKRSAGWIWDLIRTYRAFPNSQVRLDYLSFTHHVEAAKSEKYGKPREVLEKAHDKEWNAKELQGYVETGVEPVPKENRKKPELPAHLQNLYDRAAQEHLDATILMVRGQMQTPPDPLLGSAYRRCVEILEWQRDRTLETDCLTIMKVFASEDGSESPEEASDDYVAAWLTARGFIIGDDELGTAGCPKGCKANHEHDNEGSGRLGLMRRLKLLLVLNRDASRGPTQRGSIPGVLSPDPGYFEELDRISSNPRAPERSVAQHKDWIERLTRYAPELLPKEKAA